jgi:hypothetical protein
MAHNSIDCSYCSDAAIGYGAEREPTCGSSSCEPVVSPFPRVIEVSGDDDEESDS